MDQACKVLGRAWASHKQPDQIVKLIFLKGIPSGPNGNTLYISKHD